MKACLGLKSRGEGNAFRSFLYSPKALMSRVRLVLDRGAGLPARDTIVKGLVEYGS